MEWYEERTWFDRKLSTLDGEKQDTLRDLLVAMGDNTFDDEFYISSQQGAHFLKHHQLLLKYRDGMDNGVRNFWRNYGKGLIKELHDTDTDTPWMSYVPVSAHLPENRGKKYPLLFQVNRKTDFLAEGYGHAFICAEEEVILVYPYIYPNTPVKLSLADEGRAMPKGENILKILERCLEQLPVDQGRMYLAGFSSPGFRAAAFACQHPSLFAGVMLNSFLFPYFWDLPSEEEQKEMGRCRIPVININGKCDYGRPVPVYQDLHENTNNGHDHDRTMEEAMLRPNLWFKANDCPTISLDKALETRTFSSERQAEKEIGLPCPKAYTHVIDDVNHYIADFPSRDGIVRVRLIAVENCPHWMHGSFARLQWNFIRHFSRDLSTGASIYQTEV